MNEQVIIKQADGSLVNFMPSRADAITAAGTTPFQAGILYCGVGGDLAVVPAGQTASVLFAGVPDGTFLPIHIKCISATTGASNLLICY